MGPLSFFPLQPLYVPKLNSPAYRNSPCQLLTCASHQVSLFSFLAIWPLLVIDLLPCCLISLVDVVLVKWHAPHIHTPTHPHPHFLYTASTLYGTLWHLCHYACVTLSVLFQFSSFNYALVLEENFSSVFFFCRFTQSQHQYQHQPHSPTLSHHHWSFCNNLSLSLFHSLSSSHVYISNV